MVWAEVKKEIPKWVTLYSSINCAWENQNAPQPNRPFISLRISSFTKISEDVRLLPKPDFTRTLYRFRKFTVDISYIGNSDPVILLDELLGTLERRDVQAAFRAVGLVPTGFAPINDTTFLEQNSNVQRADSSIFFNTMFEYVYGTNDDPETSIIESVVVNEEYDPTSIEIEQTIP